MNKPETIISSLTYTVFEAEQLEANPHLIDYAFTAVSGHDGVGIRYGIWDELNEVWREVADYASACKLARTFVNVVRAYYGKAPEIHFPEDETAS